MGTTIFSLVIVSAAAALVLMGHLTEDEAYQGGLVFVGTVGGLLGFAALYWCLLNAWRE